jgi:redox-sensitive bicupin YhaK (pirin superfamily)
MLSQGSESFPFTLPKIHSLSMTTLRRSKDRGHANHGWLDARHSFSFADYYDPKWMGFRSLRVINEDQVQPGMGFGTHPHRDMEIITYILSGSLQHRDSMGNGRVIQTGDVQYMAAGSGVQHSEFNPSSSEPVHLLQIWIVPDHKGAKPTYAEKSLTQAAPNQWHLITSKSGRDGSIPINQDANLSLAKVETGQRLAYTLTASRHAWIQVATGDVEIQGHRLQAGDALAVSGEDSIQLTAHMASQVLLFDLN